MSQLEVSTTPRLAPAPVETGVANRTRRWLPDIAGVTVVLAILGYYWARFGHLFPQVEFIDWISWPARPIITDGLRDMFTFADDGGFTRHVPLMYAAALGRVCGGNATCVNAMVFLPLLVGAPAFYALGRLLGLGAAAATGVVVVTLISQPTFDVLVWQATLLDRMALAAVPVMMILVYVAVRHTRLSWRYVVPWAVGLSVLGLLTLNIKEPAWVMAPLVVLAPVLLARDRREARAAAVTLAAPLVVMIVHLTTNLAAVWASPAYRKHVAEGSITDNLSTLTRFVIPGGLPVLIVAALLGVAGVALAVRARRTVPEAFTVARAAVWVGVAAVCRLDHPAAHASSRSLSTCSCRSRPRRSLSLSLCAQGSWRWPACAPRCSATRASRSASCSWPGARAWPWETAGSRMASDSSSMTASGARCRGSRRSTPRIRGKPSSSPHPTRTSPGAGYRQPSPTASGGSRAARPQPTTDIRSGQRPPSVATARRPWSSASMPSCG